MSLPKTSLCLAAIEEVKTLAADQFSGPQRTLGFGLSLSRALVVSLSAEGLLVFTPYLRFCCLLVLRF